MGVRFYTVVVDSHDPKQLAEWWAQVLDWKIVFEAPEEVVIAKDEDTYPALIFVPVPSRRPPRIGCTSTSRRMTATRRYAGSRGSVRSVSTSGRAPTTR